VRRVNLSSAASLALVLVAGLAWTSSSAFAHQRPTVRQAPLALRALAAPEAELETIGAPVNSDGAQRQYGLDSGLLRRYWLRAHAPQVRSGAKARTVAEEFLAAHAEELGLAAGALDKELEFTSEKGTPSGTHLRWDQAWQGVPVYRSEIVVKVSADGQVSSVQNNLRPDVKVATVPAIDGAAAIAVARNLVAPTGRALAEPKSTLLIVDSRTGPRLAWLVQMPVEAPMGDWWVFVDAASGVAFGAEDRMVYAEGTGRVFDPDPMSKMGDSSYVDNSDADSAVPFPAAYDLRPLHDITLSAGVYSLSGPYVQLIDDESPTFAPVTAAHPDSFRFQRNAQGFEDVMCYYQLDASQRYIQSLGFTNINNRVQPVDSHGLSGADNSHYVPSTGHLAFGEGGVDDDEDADVIWHEYGHSIQDNIVSGWGGGQEGQMGEGWGDYWAASYSRSLYPSFQPNRVFTWDGNGDTWTGRVLIDTALHYPADCCGEVHDSGTLWCSALTDCWNHLGREVTDRIVLDHHFALGTTATMADAASQVIQSDIDLYGGAHVATLVERFGFWGMVDPAAYVPQMAHTPLADVESVAGPYAVVATVVSVKPLAAGFPRLYWGFGGSITDSVTMTPTANPNEFTANIPGPGADADVRYYLRATDTGAGTATAPSTAPATPYVFHAGADVTPPTIAHTPRVTFPAPGWPAGIQATITDALGVNPATVQVNWTLNGSAKAAFTLARVGVTSNWSATFPSTFAEVVPGDVVAYHITASDLATTPNTARAPASGEYSFTLIASAGSVLVLDDDIVGKSAETKVVVDEKDPAKQVTLRPAGATGVLSANLISGWLSGLGYTTTVESAAASNPTTWPGYSFIVSTSGSNSAPAANATYRAALETYVAAGHKLLVEGGEVGYDAISYPAYPTFAANVLHGSTWSTDNAGALQRLSAQATHPLANLPNVLPAAIALTYASYGNEDSYAPVSPAYTVYGTTTQAGNVGISVYDNNSSPQSAQVVVFAFDLKVVTDTTVARRLLENAAHFLLAPEPAPNSSITGRVAVGSAWGGAGTTVTLQPGGATTTTSPSGEFAFTSLYAGTYSLGATLAGYSGTPRVVTVGQDATGSVVLRLYPAAQANGCNSPAVAIPDNSATGITNVITVVPSFLVSGVEASVNITHTWRGDLIVELRHNATTVRLHNRTGGSADNLVGSYPGTLTPSGPGALTDFAGQASDGTWTLFVSDNVSSDTGTLNQWCLTLVGASDTTQTVGIDPAQAALALEFAPVWPNPTHGGAVTMSFALPRSAATRLALYDVGGRLVRTVADRVFSAGRSTLVWDGRDDRGVALRPGLYLARFTSSGSTLNRRFVVLQ
jgi:zinc metalloprotease ZmpB